MHTAAVLDMSSAMVRLLMIVVQGGAGGDGSAQHHVLALDVPGHRAVRAALAGRQLERVGQPALVHQRHVRVQHVRHALRKQHSYCQHVRRALRK